ncbi:leucine-rich repeat domain-containing protein [Bernardetia sp. Wsw4-3y2]|uniref:leucine-rich repeat domain-containing protein n=1 Tax=Bernardetia sp. Wsw4-3y2 TaxID=3127471 RepID=UPI0030D0B6B1
MKKYLFTLLFVLFFYLSFSICGFAQMTVIENDSLVLVDIYQSTNGSGWINTWKLDQKITTWNGVTVQNQRVVGLNFSRRNLTDSLPSSLGNLSELRSLNISFNNLTGSLEMLTMLYKLKVFSMAGTKYKESYGNVPSIFGQMRQLTYLDMSQNGFTAPISDTTGFFLLTNLQELYINSNSFNGRMQNEFGEFKKLKTFNISSCRFSGALPASLTNLTLLEEFYLASNAFDSDLGLIVSAMPNLRVLSAASNRLGRNRVLPRLLYELSKLTYLDLSNNEYKLYISALISNLKNLQTLLLQNNKLSGELPLPITNLPKLVTCNLSNNSFSGTIPIRFYYSPSLKTLILSRNKFKDVLPVGLNLPSKLSYLDLSYNLFQTKLLNSAETSVGSFDYFPNLTYLDVSYNNLEDFDKIEFYTLKNLATIKLNNNKLKGQIPIKVASIVSLISFDISANKFEGTLPAQIGNMSKIQTFRASTNSLEGEIPRSFFTPSSTLRTLDLSRNKFSSIENIDSLTRLQVINVSNNNLTFGDLEGHIKKIPNFTYSPQQNIPIIQPCYLQVQTRGEFNQYQWFFNGDSIKNATDSVFAAKRIGTYYVKVKNDSVPRLILTSEKAIVTEFTVPDNNFPNENFKDTTFCEPFEYQLIATETGIDYLWSTGDSTQSITISEEGVYTVWVDNGFCTVMDTVRINFAGVKNNIISSSQRVCREENPSLLTGDSSLVGHTYLWQSSIDSLNWTDLDTTLNYQPQELFTSTYFRRKVTPNSFYNCDAKYSNVVLIEVSNLKVEAQTTNVSCFGGNDGKIELEITGAFDDYQILWENGSTNSSLENLKKGNYKVKVIDGLGCQDSLLIEIAEPQKLEGNFIIKEPTCNSELNNGAISLLITGGTEPYQTVWTYQRDTLAINTNEISALEPNENEKYEVRITDANGCEFTVSNFLTRQQPVDSRFNYDYDSYCKLEINPKPTILGVKNGFFFTNDTGIELDSLSGEIYLNTSAQGMYKIIYQADECSADTVFVEINGDCFAGIPNTFTPNNDGTNDTWQVPFLERYPNADIEIFDRTGKILFTQKNGYKTEWNGLLNGMKLAEGTYYYRIRISDSLKPITGYISIVR